MDKCLLNSGHTLESRNVSPLRIALILCPVLPLTKCRTTHIKGMRPVNEGNALLYLNN